MPLSLQRVGRRLSQLHRDEGGVISLLTVFVMLGCTWLLLWVINSARQLETRVRMQNAVDAAGQSGTAILARGMNAIAFANQLEFDLLAAVATMRVAPQVTGGASPLARLLPTFEELLNGSQPNQPPALRPIPAFRYAVVTRMPLLASEMARDIGRASGAWRGVDAATNPDGPQGPLYVVLWTPGGRIVGQGSEQDPWWRVLPVMDPNAGSDDEPWIPDSQLREAARELRRRSTRGYLGAWALDLARNNANVAAAIEGRARLELDRMLTEEYVDTNLPMMLRPRDSDREALEADLMFVAVAYRLHPRPMGPLLFRNPNAALAPAMAVAQTHLFLPRARYTCCPWTEDRFDPVSGEVYTIVHTDGWPGEWHASIQNWHTKLVPATSEAIGSILTAEVDLGDGTIVRSGWGTLTPEQWDAVSHQ